ncbi:MAG: hypothetical protein KUG77_14485 [Nannocystaceae bacterium]|nr:hypothetical protein [Nannocystaceae bacterium]
MDYRGVVALMGLVLGCGPAVDADNTGSGSGTAGGTSGGASSTDASTTGPDASTSEADTGGGLCPELLDGPLPNLVIPVEITNTRANAVYVGYESDCLADLFQISRADGSTVNWHGRTCTPSCETVMAGECFDCGACAKATMLRIAPGATYTYDWTPTEYDLLDFPAQCAAPPCSTICDRQHELEAGEYRFDLVASTDCDGDGMTCECGNGQDACQVYPWSWPETTLSASAQVSLPSDVVSLTIE